MTNPDELQPTNEAADLLVKLLSLPSSRLKELRYLIQHADTMANRPNIVCLCGSTRFSAAYQSANFTETLKGNIVLTIGCDMRSDDELFKDKTESELAEIKARLDWLHLRKIDLADEILVLNVGGYVGHSTMREIVYAHTRAKTIRWLEPDKAIPIGTYMKG